MESKITREQVAEMIGCQGYEALRIEVEETDDDEWKVDFFWYDRHRLTIDVRAQSYQGHVALVWTDYDLDWLGWESLALLLMDEICT